MQQFSDKIIVGKKALAHGKHVINKVILVPSPTGKDKVKVADDNLRFDIKNCSPIYIDEV